MKKTDKFWEVHYKTNQKGWRTIWTTKATSRASAIGIIAERVANVIEKDTWFRFVDCINVTEQVKEGTYVDPQDPTHGDSLK